MTGGGVLRRASKALAVALLAALVFELAVRCVLFAPLLDGTRLAARLRLPAAVAHPQEDLYWWLRTHFGHGTGPEAAAESHHPELGWTRWAGLDLADHPDRAPLAGRRRVLLYGDSFAACQTPDGECFQGLLARSELGATHTLVNYGVHGYGLDQILMLLRRTVDAYIMPEGPREGPAESAARSPVVLVGLLVDRDLDRAGLAYRGGMSKPRFDVVDGELVLRPPLAAGVLPPRPPAWYGARLLVHALRLGGGAHELVCRQRRALERNRERCRLLLEALVAECEGRGLEASFLLFHSREHLERSCWEEQLVTSTLDRAGARWRSTRPALVGHARASGRGLDEYFDTTGHLDGLGNFAAFRAIEDELLGRPPDAADPATWERGWEQGELLGPLSPSAFAATEVGGPRGVVRHEIGARAQFPSDEQRPRLLFRVARRGPARLEYDLAGRAAAFSATPVLSLRKGDRGEGRVGLTLEADGDELLHLVVERGRAPERFEVDLTGRRRLAIVVEDGGDGVAGDELALAQPRFTRARP